MTNRLVLRSLPPSIAAAMAIQADGGMRPFTKSYTDAAMGIRKDDTITTGKRPPGYTNPSFEPITEEEATPKWYGNMPNPPAQLSWPGRDDDAFGPGTSRVTFRPEGAENSSFKPNKAAGLSAKFAALAKKSASFAKSIDRALELNVVGQLDDRTYQGLVRYRDLLARATPSARKGFKADPEYGVVLSRIESAPIAQVDKDTLRKSLQ